MSGTARLAAYVAVLGLAFGGGAALGAAIGPDPAPTDHSTTVDHDDSTETRTHERKH